VDLAAPQVDENDRLAQSQEGHLLRGEVMNRRSPMLIFIAILALIQGVLGVFRAFEWFNIGADLFGQGLVILPLVGVVAIFHGGLIIVLAMLYLLFAVGMFLQKSWARWLGLSVAAISVLLVINVVIQGESVLRAGFWLIAPIIIAVYLLSQSGRAAATRVNS
jgi:hypothetical protein